METHGGSGPDRLEKFLSRIQNLRILVVGDLILDRFLSGNVRRISPEAPVPVVEVSNEDFCAGGAGNVCENIASLGAGVSVVGIVGDDVKGEMLCDLLSRAGSEVVTLRRTSGITTEKTRVMGLSQQLLRIDTERLSPLSSSEWKAIKKLLSEELDRFDGVIISDYGKGMVGLPLIRFLSKECGRRKICLTVDPKISHFSYYRNVDCLTPNRMEAILGYGVSEPKSQEELFSLGRKIRKDLSLQNLVITQGKEGMSLFTDKGACHLASFAREVFDVTGAGDTVIAVITLGLVSGLSLLDSAIFANLAASVVVQKLRTAVVTPEELRAVSGEIARMAVSSWQ
ncbi:MAG: PfkB family carbohydrate kinase [Candidatus Ratteibacteria bacterium]|jgi:rfaE bifunctional protein kinase chain/domain